ncbi:MAG: hypothetical protein CBB92_10960 [Flammeovirgaceae bacterium TMED32]|nr:MAG: hypothetical protein CBB92_10960 [Flammeovirgaceae bacterium TMED32]
MKNIKPFFLLLLFGSCVYTNENLEPDQQTWNYALPNQFSLIDNDFLNLNEAILNDEYRNIHALVIIKNDQLIFENYYLDQQREDLNNIDNATNILASIAIGMAIDDGYLISIETPIADLLPEYENELSNDSLKKTITIRQLLTHRSGLSWDEIVSENDLEEMMNSNDWVKNLLKKPLDAIPGRRYNFNSGASMILSKIIQNLTNETLSSYIDRRLFKALEIDGWLWTTDPSGTTNATNGLYLTQLDFTKIGYLLLKNGVWKNQVILSDDWIHESTNVQHQPSYFYSLGYLWFQFTEEEGNAPYNSELTFYIPGQTGYHLYINPEENLIVSVGAKNYFYKFFGPSYWLYFAIMDLHQDYL